MLGNISNQARRLNENEYVIGVIIDGKHRLVKALLDGDEYIRAVKFTKDPDEIWEYEEK
jgi:hypothetical protein